MSEDARFMRVALRLAQRGSPSPNPYVGAVLVKNGGILATGYHAKAGMPHAEAAALAKAGNAARGATLYVMLEPCCHSNKRTPPCTAAIIRAGVSRVVCAMRDPNPMVNGRGMRILRRAGIPVECGLLESEARGLNEAFCKYMETRMPFVTLKTAMSENGKITYGNGKRKWITGDKARAYARRQRARYDAILVGINTVLKDDPLLTTRANGLRDPLRVILDSRLRIPLDANALLDNNVLVATTKRCDKGRQRMLERIGIRVATCGRRRVDMPNLMRALGRMGVTSVLIEGGSETNASALRAGIVDKFAFYIAPKRIKSGLPAIKGFDAVALSKSLRDARVKKIGRDTLVEGYPRNKRDLILN
jgi:diaminohydroxyphosphoribosylaminopyrimidine deaminase/5-amino-6-(5-phosphoribosylamino)uracil reductase